jgi:hypothetical protein
LADLIITGVHPYDGRYPLDLETEFTTREWGWLKRLAGYLPLQLDDNAFADPELACVLAVIVLHRAGTIERTEVPKVFDRIVDAPFGSTITIEADEDAEADAGPPASSSNGSSATSGASSPASSETSAPTQPPTGTPGLASSVSDPSTLVT